MAQAPPLLPPSSPPGPSRPRHPHIHISPYMASPGYIWICIYIYEGVYEYLKTRFYPLFFFSFLVTRFYPLFFFSFLRTRFYPLFFFSFLRTRFYPLFFFSFLRTYTPLYPPIPAAYSHHRLQPENPSSPSQPRGAVEALWSG